MQLQLTEDIEPQDEAFILDRLKAYNVETFGQSDRRDLAIKLHAEDGALIGGLTGYTGRDWLYISMLFVPEEMRGRGLAARMLDMAETEARARDCIGAYIDTMNPQAARLYRRLGYAEIGSLRHLAGCHCITWFEKRFTPAKRPASRS